MKPNLSVEFLRGLLFAYVAFRLYVQLRAAHFALVYAESTPWFAAVLLAVDTFLYGALGYALLFTPRGHARFVTIFLAVIVLIYLFSILWWNQIRPPEISSPFNPVVITQLVIGTFLVGVAYFYQRLLKKNDS